MRDPAQGSTQDLRALFNPASIALVGATDKSRWSLNTYANLRRHGFPGPVRLVNPRTETVHGERAYRSLSDLPEVVDLAYVMVPTASVIAVLEEGARLGIRNYVVLTAGFGDSGAEGRRCEEELAALSRANGLTVLGPNGNGFVNAAAGIAPYGLPVRPPLLPGSVGVVTHSGALAGPVLALSRQRNIGVSLLTSIGNEAVISMTDVIDHLVDDPATRVIALFMESIRHPAEFAAAARRALAAGKPIVALKVGRSATSATSATSARGHTGALIGDDDVVEAAFRRLGVLRVRSLEDLVVTAGLLASYGPLPGRRLGVVTPSGGASEAIADRAQDEGLELPAFAEETVARLNEIIPVFGSVRNPLDVTGYVLVDRTLLIRAVEIVAADPGIDVVVLMLDPQQIEPLDLAPDLRPYESAARVITAASRPVVVVGNALTDVGEFTRTLQERTGFPHIVGGIEHGMQAIGAAVRWAAHRRGSGGSPMRTPAPVPAPMPAPDLCGPAMGVRREHRAATLLAQHGVPVIPSEQVCDEESAVAAAGRFGYPVVLKAVAEGPGRPSEIGPARPNLGSADEVRRAYREICAARGRPAIGALVRPSRTGGIELMVGIVRDRAWGPVLAVGLGGTWVEILTDSALRLLPVDPAEVRRAFGELRGAKLLEGVRGSEPADLEAVARVVAQICELAEALGDGLESLEVNPLFVQGSRVEAVDALVTWRT